MIATMIANIFIANLHTAGVPYDGVPNNRLVTIEFPLAVFYIILGALGIVFAVSCLCFNFIFRKKPLVYIKKMISYQVCMPTFKLVL